MKTTKKIIAVIIALTTLAFSFPSSGFANGEEGYDDETYHEETDDEWASFEDIKLFDGYLVLGYSSGYPDWEFVYEVVSAESGETVVSASMENDKVSFDEESVIVTVDNNAFDENTVYKLAVTVSGNIFYEKEFTLPEILATQPQFKDANYGLEEYDRIDMTEEILMPVGYSGQIYLTCLNSTGIDGKFDNEVFCIEGMTVIANKRGLGWIYLTDSERNCIDEAWFHVRKNEVYTIKDAIGLSFRKFFDRAGESAEDFLLIIGNTISGIVGAIVVPLTIITSPIRMLFSDN